MTASAIIERFAGTSALADALGVPVSTVHSWGRYNQIPAWRQPKILALATERGIELSTADFPSPDERVAA